MSKTSVSQAYVEGFLAECYHQGLMEKTATVLLLRALHNDSATRTKQASVLEELSAALREEREQYIEQN